MFECRKMFSNHTKLKTPRSISPYEDPFSHHKPRCWNSPVFQVWRKSAIHWIEIVSDNSFKHGSLTVHKMITKEKWRHGITNFAFCLHKDLSLYMIQRFFQSPKGVIIKSYCWCNQDCLLLSPTNYWQLLDKHVPWPAKYCAVSKKITHLSICFAFPIFFRQFYSVLRLLLLGINP